MSSLLEIEQAAEKLPREQRRELVRFLTEGLSESPEPECRPYRFPSRNLQARGGLDLTKLAHVDDIS